MSTVRADNFAKRDGSSSITADTLIQGTAKAWWNLNGTGTIAARDSFNISSFVDNGAGQYAMNFAVARPSVNYSPVLSNAYLGNGAYFSDVSTFHGSFLTVAQANQVCGYYLEVGTNNVRDQEFVFGHVAGDPV